MELKAETIEERLGNLEQRLKTMNDKYETSLKSIWSVFGITKDALFDHLTLYKGT